MGDVEDGQLTNEKLEAELADPSHPFLHTNHPALHVATFLLWTGLVAIFTWVICTKYMKSKKGESASDIMFKGGSSLTWYIVAGSLMLTNLSTVQLVGLNGSIFKNGNMGGSGWETLAAIAMCITAVIFLPRYLQGGLATTTGFLAERFDLCVRSLVSIIFLLFYTFSLLPVLLHTGALAFEGIFDLKSIPHWAITTTIGLIGALYALFGGLKAVAVSDCLNGVGLVIVGLWVPIGALQYVGGIENLFSTNLTVAVAANGTLPGRCINPAQYLKPFVSTSEIFEYDEAADMGVRALGTPEITWGRALAGMMLPNLFYWTTNQLIVQRALAAKSLAEGQKGVLFAALMKVVGFTFLCIPGIMGLVMMEIGAEVNGEPFAIKKSDFVYGALVKATMPKWALGFFAAVLLGSVLSSYNSALNSASTLFGLEVYKVYLNPSSSDDNVVTMANRFGLIVALFSFLIAPLLVYVGSIFDYLQKISSLISLPILLVFIVGIATKTPDAFAAKVSFAVAFVVYFFSMAFEQLELFGFERVHFLYKMPICFVIGLVAFAVATYVPPLRKLCGVRAVPKAFEQSDDDDKEGVSMEPWKYRFVIVGGILVAIVLLSIALQFGLLWFFVVFCVFWLLLFVVLMLLPTQEEDDEDSEEESEDGDGDDASD